jgi:hypothetical protein
MKSSVCSTFEIQLYGLLKLLKHRNYDVWKGDVTYAQTEEQIAKNVPGPKSGVFLVQRKTFLSRSLGFLRSREKLQAIHFPLVGKPYPALAG